MADNYNIRMADGTVITVPGWASEDTLKLILQQMQRANVLDDKLFNIINGVTIDTDDIANALEDLLDNQEEQQTEEKKQRKQYSKQVARGVSNLIDKFSDTDKPLSKMVDMVGDLGGAAKEGVGGLDNFGKAGKSLKEGITKMIPGLEAAGAVGMAWLGFNAAKLEQFAEAQSNMIDAGAIFYDSSQTFDDLFRRSMDAGISYTQLTKIAQGYGGALQSLGSGVSQGTVRFLDMFSDLNKSADALGDFGLTSTEMAETYAEYINVARLTGQINRETNDVQATVQKSFTNLMIESTALANLTSENRSEILKRQMAALTGPELAAALKTMRDRGNIREADVATEFTKQLALMSPQLGPIGDQLGEAITGELFATVENPQNFDIRKRLDTTTIAAFDELMPGLIDKINTGIRTGEIENASNILVQSFANMDQSRKGSAIAASGTLLNVMQQLQVAGMQVQMDMGKVAEMSAEEREAANVEAAKKLEESGQMTKNMNDLTIAFMNVQDALTVNLADASDTVEGLTGILNSGAEKISKFFGTSLDTRNPYLPPSQTQSNRYDEFGDLDLEQRAMGGPVSSGKPYLVGEQGPEIIIPDQSGSVIPNNSVKNMIDSSVATDSMIPPEKFLNLHNQGWDVTYDDVSKKWYAAKESEDGSSKKINADGSYSISSAEGIRRYDSGGKLVSHTLPTLVEGLAVTDLAEGGRNLDYSAGSGTVSQRYGASGDLLGESVGYTTLAGIQYSKNESGIFSANDLLNGQSFSASSYEELMKQVPKLSLEEMGLRMFGDTRGLNSVSETKRPEIYNPGDADLESIDANDTTQMSLQDKENTLQLLVQMEQVIKNITQTSENKRNRRSLEI
jgi:hypothetical protein